MEGGRTGRGRGGALARSRRLEDRFVLRENDLNTVIEQGQPNTTDRFAQGECILQATEGPPGGRTLTNLKTPL